MTSRERLRAAWSGAQVDYVPLCTWCFGVRPPANLAWERDGMTRSHWYSLRMEHIHTLPQPWTLEDDFQRALAWQSLGVDDVLDVSVPWSVDPDVTWEDSVSPAGEMDRLPVLVRDYQTPAGPLRHAVRQTGEDPGPGWVVQPDHVPLIEDFNIPRGVKHAVAGPDDVPMAGYLYGPPDEDAKQWWRDRMGRVKAFADQNGVAAQAWSGFGMDGVVWLTGVEGAIMLAMDHPGPFQDLVEMVFAADLARTELAARTDGVDMVVSRGWYSSTDLWSPRLFDRYIYPYIVRLAGVAHDCGKRYGYTMTTGVERLGKRLVDAGVDVLYFVDPVQDAMPLEKARDLLGGRMTLVGGTNALTLVSGDRGQIGAEVERALEVLGATNRFVLQPVDALFPDTPWEGIEAMIEAWKRAR